jgi:hypothetical protein
MDLIKLFLRQYWLNLLACGVFAADVVRYVRLAEWEQRLAPFAFAAFGFVSVVASEEVADWTGRYGWTRQQWWQDPPSYVRFTGGVMLIVATIVLYRR